MNSLNRHAPLFDKEVPISILNSDAECFQQYVTIRLLSELSKSSHTTKDQMLHLEVSKICANRSVFNDHF